MKVPEIEIRKALAGDADAAIKLWTQAYVTEGEGGRTTPYTDSDFFELLDRGEVFVAARAGEVVGVAALLPPGAPGRAVATEREAELSRLAVSPTARRRGAGGTLVERCERRAGELGADAIALWSRRYQEAAHRLYEARGYRRAPERDTVDETGHERVVYRLLLPTSGKGCASADAWRILPGGAWLRLLEIDDSEELHSLIEANRAQLAPWLPWAADQTLFDTVTFVDRTRRQLGCNDGFQLAVVRESRIAGVIGHHGIDWTNRSTGIGYWLAAEEQGKGTMTEATRTLTDHAFSIWRLNRVEIRIATDNERSMRIPHRLGFHEEGTLREAERIGGRYVDLVVYSMLAGEWLTRSPAPRR